jgi:hypothetical protein
MPDNVVINRQQNRQLLLAFRLGRREAPGE